MDWQQLPKQKLVDFQESTLLEEGEGCTVYFELEWSHFALWRSSEGAKNVVPGIYELWAVASGFQLSRTVEVVPRTTSEIGTDYS